ncbi:hypothetical protein CNMCM6106_002523 [Aspergillus hiratsukae]|uniref:Uncharacterized protein n=1 Tax=Aspergillus hiratsukae TaxID=1194566 RepID=A0A8H6Q6U2_9EURO|nr:hypothetical protein CNMCM6106_002523 [Aspergillus hiratsukae]
MRRRLWNTILEVKLQSSLTSGSPSLLSLNDFDTAPPGNFNDEQLEAQDSVPRPEGGFTELSMAVALRRAFPYRLDVVKFLNDLTSPGIYEETLRLDAELREAYRMLARTLRACTSSDDGPSQFEIQVVNLLMHRYFSALHIPFFNPTRHRSAYAFSQKTVVESSLKLWPAACPSPSSMTVALTNGRGSLVQQRSAATRRLQLGLLPKRGHTCCLSHWNGAVHPVQEEDDLCPAPLRPELLWVLEDAKAWLRVIKAGETHVKDYLLMSMVSAWVEGLVRGLGEKKVIRLLVKAVENVGEKCLPILEEMAASIQEQDDTQQSMAVEMINDWNFLKLPDVPLNPGDTEPMSSSSTKTLDASQSHCKTLAVPDSKPSFLSKRSMREGRVSFFEHLSFVDYSISKELAALLSVGFADESLRVNTKFKSPGSHPG